MIYYVLSLVAHVAIIAAFTLTSGKKEQNSQNNPHSETNFTIIDQTEVEKNQTEVVKVPDAPKAEPKKPEKCEKWYGGIGVIVNYTTTGTIIHTVYANYPAAEAGLKAGDRIIEASGEILGQPGTVLTLVIERNGIYYDVKVIRGEICYGDGPDKSSP